MKIDVPTVHNEAKFGEIASTVLMPGDPLRAKYIADTYLENVHCYNRVRNMFGFTGEYKGLKISVQGSGMGVPSMGIYSKELFEGYGVENIIRIGSAGSLANNEASKITNEVNVRDIIVAKTIDSDSNYLISCGIEDTIFPECSGVLLEKLLEIDRKNNLNLKYGEVFTSDVFYSSRESLIERSKKDIIGVEMETLALYANAKASGKNAIAIYTVSDNPITGEQISSNEREIGLDKMIRTALDLAYECEK